MSYERIEDDIKERLKAISPLGYETEIMPEFVSNMQEPFVKPRVTVFCNGSEYEKPKSTATIVQDEMVQVQVTIESKKLRGKEGVHHVASVIQKLLVGFKPKDCNRLYLVKSKYVDFSENVWTWCLMFHGSRMIVEAECDEDGPKITDINYIDQN